MAFHVRPDAGHADVIVVIVSVAVVCVVKLLLVRGISVAVEIGVASKLIV